MKNGLNTIDDFRIGDNRKKFETEKKSFLSHISHGIRTPLNSIMGFSKLLSLRENIDSKQQDYIKGIIDGGNLLLQFVDNIIDLAQFESNNYSLRIGKYNINTILWEFTEEFYDQKIENNDDNINLMLVWDNKHDNVEVDTDSILLKKALHRMISLFTAKFPTEELELGYRRINGNNLTLFVRHANNSSIVDDVMISQKLSFTEKDNSFDYFNYKVLINSLSVLNSEGLINTDYEFSFNIPLNFNKNRGLNLI